MGNFIVYTDKSTNFEFNVEVEGASLNEASARLILSGEKTNYILEGSIKKNGSALIEIPKFKGLAQENFSGEMKLEVIVEDSYFQPWTGPYRVSASKKVTVNEIASQKEKGKPSMVVKVKENTSPYQKRIDTIVEDLRGRKITSKNILNKTNKKYLYSLVEVTFKKPLSGLDSGVIITDIINTLQG